MRMLDSLRRIKIVDNEAGIVKLADRITNLQKPPDHWDSTKKSEYLEEARIIAEHLSAQNEYLSKRLNLKIQEYKNYL